MKLDFQLFANFQHRLLRKEFPSLSKFQPAKDIHCCTKTRIRINYGFIQFNLVTSDPEQQYAYKKYENYRTIKNKLKCIALLCHFIILYLHHGIVHQNYTWYNRGSEDVESVNNNDFTATINISENQMNFSHNHYYFWKQMDRTARISNFFLIYLMMGLIMNAIAGFMIPFFMGHYSTLYEKKSMKTCLFAPQRKFSQ